MSSGRTGRRAGGRVAAAPGRRPAALLAPARASSLRRWSIEPARPHPDQPGRADRQARPSAGHCDRRRDQRFLQGVLGGVEMAAGAGPAPRARAAHRPARRPRSVSAHASWPPAHIAGRSSMVSPGSANWPQRSPRPARASATSTRKNPARCSLDSAYGPSVATRLAGGPAVERRRAPDRRAPRPTSSSPLACTREQRLELAIISARCSAGSARLVDVVAGRGGPTGSGWRG